MCVCVCVRVCVYVCVCVCMCVCVCAEDDVRSQRKPRKAGQGSASCAVSPIFGGQADKDGRAYDFSYAIEIWDVLAGGCRQKWTCIRFFVCHFRIVRVTPFL